MRLRTYNEWLKGQRRWEDIAIDEVVASPARGDLLRKIGVKTAGQEAERPDRDLLAVPGIGSTTVEAIRRRILSVQEHEVRMRSARAASAGGNLPRGHGREPTDSRH